MPGWRNIRISGGALLLAAFLYYLDGGELIVPALAACALHELGHVMVIRLAGGRITGIRISCIGAEMRLAAARPMSCGGEAAAALAGPAVNLLLALLAARLGPTVGERAYLFAGLNLSLALFNLLPVPALDGGRALCCLLRRFGREESGREALSALGRGAGVGLIAIWAAEWRVRRPNPTLLLAGLWLLSQNQRNKC